MRVQLHLLLFLSLFSVTMSYSQFSETISSDRPGQSNSPNTVGKMVLQFQTGPQFDGANTDNNNINVFHGRHLFVLGLLKKLRFKHYGVIKTGKLNFKILSSLKRV